MTARNPKIDAFLDRAARWQEEMRALRDILLECGLTEELKWGKPCYTAHGGNIVILQPLPVPWTTTRVSSDRRARTRRRLSGWSSPVSSRCPGGAPP
jgi:hypothetical protein